MQTGGDAKEDRRPSRGIDDRRRRGACSSGKAFAQEPPKPAQIVVNHSGGSMGTAMRKAFFNGFEKKYGIRVVETSPADFGKLRAMVEFRQRRMGRHRDRRPGRDPRHPDEAGREDRRQDRRPLEISREGAQPVRLRLVGLHHHHRLSHRRVQRRHASPRAGPTGGTSRSSPARARCATIRPTISSSR